MSHYRRDYERRPRNWRNDPELIRQHHASLTVTCQRCRQPPGEPCVRCDPRGVPTTEPLNNLPCHTIRYTDSRRPKQL